MELGLRVVWFALYRASSADLGSHVFCSVEWGSDREAGEQRKSRGETEQVCREKP